MLPDLRVRKGTLERWERLDLRGLPVLPDLRVRKGILALRERLGHKVLRALREPRGRPVRRPVQGRTWWNATCMVKTSTPRT